MSFCQLRQRGGFHQPCTPWKAFVFSRTPKDSARNYNIYLQVFHQHSQVTNNYDTFILCKKGKSVLLELRVSSTRRRAFFRWKVSLLYCMALHTKLHLKPYWSQHQPNTHPLLPQGENFFFLHSRHHCYSFEDYNSTDLQAEQSIYTPKHKSSHMQRAKEENLPVMVGMPSHPFKKQHELQATPTNSQVETHSFWSCSTGPLICFH